MICPLCTEDRSPAVRIEQWIVCEDCQSAPAIDLAANYLRDGDLNAAQRCINESRIELAQIVDA